MNVDMIRELSELVDEPTKVTLVIDGVTLKDVLITGCDGFTVTVELPRKNIFGEADDAIVAKVDANRVRVIVYERGAV